MSEQHPATNLVSVYKAHPENVRQVLKTLRRRGLHPVALDDPDPTVVYASRWTYVARIAVPSDEVDAAREALANMELHSAPTVRALDRCLKRMLLRSLLVAVGVAVILRAFCQSWHDTPWGYALLAGGLSFLLFGNLDRLRGARR